MMKNIFFIFLLAAIVACDSGNHADQDNSNKVEVAPEDLIDTYEERIEEINKYTAQMYDDSMVFDKEIAENLLKAYNGFIESEYYFKSEAKEYMFKSGELCRALGRPHEAIKYFNLILDRDPDYKLAPAALFYKALTVGDMLNEHEEAKRLYEQFIKTYPDHELVESAKASISIEGKDLNELIKEFEKNNQSNS